MPTPQTDTLTFRAATALDVAAIYQVHIASIRGLCVDSYGPELIETWATTRDLGRYLRMFVADSRCVVAVKNDVICGFGSITLEKSRLASLFMHSDYAGKGIGKLLLQNLERIAEDSGIAALHVSASLNARDFYARQGYKTIAMGKHRFADGLEMACVEMLKSLRTLDRSQ